MKSLFRWTKIETTSPSAISAHFEVQLLNRWCCCLHSTIAKFLRCATCKHINRQIPFAMEQESHILDLAGKLKQLSKLVLQYWSRAMCALFGNKFSLSLGTALEDSLRDQETYAQLTINFLLIASTGMWGFPLCAAISADLGRYGRLHTFWHCQVVCCLWTFRNLRAASMAIHWRFLKSYCNCKHSGCLLRFNIVSGHLRPPASSDESLVSDSCVTICIVQSDN